jgi:hypothetical protein
MGNQKRLHQQSGTWFDRRSFASVKDAINKEKTVKIQGGIMTYRVERQPKKK